MQMKNIYFLENKLGYYFVMLNITLKIEGKNILEYIYKIILHIYMWSVYVPVCVHSSTYTLHWLDNISSFNLLIPYWI